MFNNIKPVFKCEEAIKNLFKTSQCLLTISVGQEIHEGDKFSATIDLVNNSFKSVIMLVDDSLQRHTMALNTNKTSDQFYDISVKEGDLWLDRNARYYGKLKNLNMIIRWDKWLNHKIYNEQRGKLISLIETDCTYRTAFEKTIDEFLRRYHHRLINKSDFKMDVAHKLCHDYLIEECTALCLWVELNCQFEVYPSKRNLAMEETHRRFITPTNPNLLKAVGIKFKNRKQLTPQQFVLDKEAVD